MKNKNFFLATIAGFVAFLVVGLSIYGLFLINFLSAHSGLPQEILEKVNKPMQEMNWVAGIVFNLAGAFMVTMILDWAGAKNLLDGLRTGALIGFLISVYWILSLLATTNVYTWTSTIAQVLGETVLIAIVGAVVGWVLGSGKSEKAVN